jgi:hypothetical protein
MTRLVFVSFASVFDKKIKARAKYDTSGDNIGAVCLMPLANFPFHVFPDLFRWSSLCFDKLYIHRDFTANQLRFPFHFSTLISSFSCIPSILVEGYKTKLLTFLPRSREISRRRISCVVSVRLYRKRQRTMTKKTAQISIPKG